jgi:hypothetical protein
MKVYVVRGSAGAYSDYRFWEVKAFTDIAPANTLCGQLNEWLVANKLHTSQEGKLAPEPWEFDGKCPLDPEFDSSSYGTQYEVWSIEVEK